MHAFRASRTIQPWSAGSSGISLDVNIVLDGKAQPAQRPNILTSSSLCINRRCLFQHLKQYAKFAKPGRLQRLCKDPWCCGMHGHWCHLGGIQGSIRVQAFKLSSPLQQCLSILNRGDGLVAQQGDCFHCSELCYVLKGQP